MKTYAKGDGGTLYHGDCLRVLREMPEASVDAVVTDPPYMIGAASTGNGRSKDGSYMDMKNAAYWYSAWMEQCWRMLKEDGYLVVFSNWRSLPMMMEALGSCGVGVSSMAVWDKEWIGPAGKVQLRPRWEALLFCGKPDAQIMERGQADVFRVKWMAAHSGGYDHPAEKPEELLVRVVELVTRAGGVVCDPFTGSGTTGAAALSRGRQFVGVEAAEKWLDVAAARLNWTKL